MQAKDIRYVLRRPPVLGPSRAYSSLRLNRRFWLLVQVSETLCTHVLNSTKLDKHDIITSGGKRNEVLIARKEQIIGITPPHWGPKLLSRS